MKPKVSLWVWNWADLANGPSLAEWKAAGVSGVLLKAGDGASIWPQFAEHAAEIKALGFALGAWAYTYGTLPNESAPYLAAAQAGADYLVIDAEGEFETLAPLAAIPALMASLKATGLPVYLSSFGQPDLHIEMRWSVWEANGIAGHLPQVFPDAWRLSPADALTTMYRSFQWVGATKPLYPALYCYPPANPRVSAAELVDALAEAEAGGYEAVSFWRAGIAGPDVLAAVRSFIGPPAPPVPSLEDRVAALEAWAQSFGKQ